MYVGGGVGRHVGVVGGVVLAERLACRLLLLTPAAHGVRLAAHRVSALRKLLGTFAQTDKHPACIVIYVTRAIIPK